VATTQRKPGPRSDINSREVLLEVAEEMFSIHGIGGSSVRSIAQTAGLGVGAVHYHFGSKDGLVKAVLAGRGMQIVERSRELALQLERRGGVISIDELVDAIIRPYFEIIDEDPERGVRTVKMISMMATQRDPRWTELAVATGDPPISSLVTDLISRALPDLDSDRARHVASLAISSLILQLANMDSPIFAHAVGPYGVDEEFKTEMKVFAAEGLRGLASRAAKLP
jgi:AcrR family transcriptional regulator